MILDIFNTSVLQCIYMHRLKWSFIGKQSVCLVDPISMMLSQILSQLRSQFLSVSCAFEAIEMEIMSSSRLWAIRAEGMALPPAPWKASFTGAVQRGGGGPTTRPAQGSAGLREGEGDPCSRGVLYLC